MKARRNPSGLFSEPESIQEQKARLARELAQLKMREDREKLAARSSRKLVGSRDDIGQTDMFGGGDLFSRKNPMHTVHEEDTGIWKVYRNGKEVGVVWNGGVMPGEKVKQWAALESWEGHKPGEPLGLARSFNGALALVKKYGKPMNPRKHMKKRTKRKRSKAGLKKVRVTETRSVVKTNPRMKNKAARRAKSDEYERRRKRKCVVRHKVKCSRRGKCRVKHAVRCNPARRRRKVHRRKTSVSSYVAIRAGGRYQLCRVSGGSLKRMGMFKKAALVRWCKAHGVKCR